MAQKLLPAPHHVARRHIPLGVWLAFGSVLLIAACGIVTRLHANSRLKSETESNSVITVSAVKPTQGMATDEINLPGSVEAFVDAPIYARTSGYLKNWYADLGVKVKKGQLLAEIETPEVDQQLGQSIAELATAKANYDLAEVTNKRWQVLVKTNAVSKQEADEKQGAAEAQKAQYLAADANVKRLKALQSFQKIYAPFDGVVTARNTDIGQLVNAGQSTGQQLFRVASVDRLRTFIPVPQAQSPYVKPGMPAELRFVERPGKIFTGTVARTANSIDATSRTLLTEVDIDNAAGELYPGAYVDVHLKLPSPASESAVRVPANTLIFRAQGLQLAVIGQDGKITLKPAVIGRDFGNEVEIVSGLDMNDQVVLNPPDSLANGQVVKIAETPQAGTAPAQDGHQTNQNSDDKQDGAAKKGDDKSTSQQTTPGQAKEKTSQAPDSGQKSGDKGKEGTQSETGQTPPGTDGTDKK